jgi:cellulose synthase/poly-beta-1,6-N-acetylglucosamine synthase-like glycosyltransferase
MASLGAAPPRMPPSDPAAPPPARERIGERLVREGVVTEPEVERALEIQRQSGGRLGEILLADGQITGDSLAKSLAEQWGLMFMDDDPTRVRPELLDADTAWELGVVAVDYRSGTWIATAEQLGHEERRRLIGEAGALPVIVTTVRKVKELLTEAYGRAGAERSREELRRADPEQSASRVLIARQVAALGVAALGVAAAAVLWPGLTATTVIALVLAYYAINSLYKMKLAYDSLGPSAEIPVTDAELAQIDERSLPVYTILVPLYKEANVARQLTDNLRRIDYPTSKLEVLLLCESDDEDTIEALRSAELPGNYHVVRVPAGEPRTKPRACNYGLLLARGEFCVIYDAEDRPEPDQLKKAVLCFRKAPPSLACVQAKLNYFNSRQNLLTRWFAAEYAFWFDLVLPGLHRNSHPIPLGGTSNHFMVSALRELHAWDPFNMTEDADLGIRLWELGRKTAMVDSVTLEEANSALGNWVRQRSRWVKGYVQTWLVHMRHPLRLARRIGIGPFLSLQFTIGGIIVTLLNPVLWGLTAVVLITDPAWVHSLLPGVLFWIALAELLVGNFIHLYLFLIGSARRGFWDLIPTLLAAPVYWLLMSISGWKGTLQLVTKPFYWEKTEHGLVDADEYLKELQAEGARGA